MLRLFTVIILSFWACVSHAAPVKYVFDKSHTNITWAASHFGFSQSVGHFMDFDGYLILDEEAPEKSEVMVTVQTSSIMTGIEKFDTHLKSADFFNVAEHPTALFKSERVDVKDGGMAIIHGQFTMLGKTYPLALNVTLNKQGKNPMSQRDTVGLSVKGVIQRNLYGMVYGLPGVSNEVDLWVEVEAMKEVKDAAE